MPAEDERVVVVSLTPGSGPLSPAAPGSLNFTPPERVVLVDPLPRRIRAVLAGRTVIDSEDVKLVHASGQLPHDVAKGARS